MPKRFGPKLGEKVDVPKKEIRNPIHLSLRHVVIFVSNVCNMLKLAISKCIWSVLQEKLPITKLEEVGSWN